MESLKELEINKESEKEDIVIKIRECSNADPKYKLALNREKSFEGCPKPFAPYVSVLAEAGFFLSSRLLDTMLQLQRKYRTRSPR